VYWATLTLGPLVLGGSLALTSYAITASQGVVRQLPGGVENLLDSTQFLVLLLAVSGLFHFVPNTHVRWRHALLGGLFVAVAFGAAKYGLAWWIQQMPAYATLYGAFATLPIFLIWIYTGWLIVLLGALLAANAPGLTQRLMQRAPTPGLELELALGVLKELWMRQQRGAAGASKLGLAQHLRVDPLQLEPVLDTLQTMDWLGRLEEGGARRLVLLRNPFETRAAPLLHALVVEENPTTRGLWRGSAWDTMTVAELLGTPNRRATDLQSPSTQRP
jgi:membrane protein